MAMTDADKGDGDDNHDDKGDGDDRVIVVVMEKQISVTGKM